jgi:excisionase family DNA binding protein
MTEKAATVASPDGITINAGGTSVTFAPEVFGALSEAVAEALDRSSRSPWLNAESAARYLDVAPKRIRNLTAAGEIPHRKQGGRVLYHRDELDRWLDYHYEGPAHFRRG